MRSPDAKVWDICSNIVFTANSTSLLLSCALEDRLGGDDTLDQFRFGHADVCHHLTLHLVNGVRYCAIALRANASALLVVAVLVHLRFDQIAHSSRTGTVALLLLMVTHRLSLFFHILRLNRQADGAFLRSTLMILTSTSSSTASAVRASSTRSRLISDAFMMPVTSSASSITTSLTSVSITFPLTMLRSRSLRCSR